MQRDNVKVVEIDEGGQKEKVLLDGQGRVVRRDQLQTILQRQQEDSDKLVATADKLAGKQKKAVDDLVIQTADALDLRIAQSQRLIDQMTAERDRLSQGDAASVDKLVTATVRRMEHRRTRLAETMNETERLLIELDAGGQ